MADGAALQASADSSYIAEVTSSSQIMRSEGLSHSPHAGDGSVAANEKLKLELYYESRCPDCIMFINNSLAPLWRNAELNQHFELTMNPYGNAMTVPMSEISEGYSFWHPEQKAYDYVHICQHGGEECFGNTIQACAISKLPQEKHMEMILCMESLPEYGLEKASYECMEKFSIDKHKIRECVNGPEGNKILAEFGEQTRKVPGRQGTPWLMVNGKHLENPDNLLKTVCAHVLVGQTSPPSSCKPFEKAAAPKKHEKKEDEHSDDWFQVLGKVNNVDKNLVMMPPPKHI
jgi:interferon gamma-inducible protein 30